MQKQKYPELFKNRNPETYDKKLLKLSNGSHSINLYVPDNIYKRANNDLQFATELFNKYNKEIVKQVPHCIDTNIFDEVENTQHANIELDYTNKSDDRENTTVRCSTAGALRHHWTNEQTKLLLFLY